MQVLTFGVTSPQITHYLQRRGYDIAHIRFHVI